MPNNIYSVKQAAKILGLSTNTTYKYLKEGRIKASRGHERGTFLITTQSLETFLGGKLPVNQISDDTNLSNMASKPSVQVQETIVEVKPPTLAIKVTRVLITLCLLLIIIDIITTKNFSPLSSFGRIFLIFVVILISYQFGGFIKK